MYGKRITVWADNHRVTHPPITHNSTVNITQTQNTTKIEIGSVRVSYKIHLLSTPIRIRPGEILKARCQYHDKSRYGAAVPVLTPFRNPREELCKITLLTMVPHSSTIGPQTCSTPADFGSEDVTLRLPKLGFVEFLQVHPFAMMALFGVLLFIGLLVMRCRKSVGENEEGRSRINTQEFQGLLRDYDEFDSNLKMK